MEPEAHCFIDSFSGPRDSPHFARKPNFPEHERSRGMLLSKNEESRADATARSVAGSVALTPPTAFRNMS